MTKKMAETFIPFVTRRKPLSFYYTEYESLGRMTSDPDPPVRYTAGSRRVLKPRHQISFLRFVPFGRVGAFRFPSSGKLVSCQRLLATHEPFGGGLQADVGC